MAQSVKVHFRGSHEGFAIYHFDSRDTAAKELVTDILTKSSPFVDIGPGKSITHHKAVVPNGQDHLHFFVKGRKVYSLNDAGVALDRSNGRQMQQWALRSAVKYLPDFKMPKDSLIDGLPGNGVAINGSTSAVLVPREELLKAEAIATRQTVFQ